jgi:hypothetical protein
MAATASAVQATYCGVDLPKVWRVPMPRSAFGDIALFAFLLVQGLDGFYTYLGVATYGLHVEANPIVAGLMAHLGEIGGLIGVKVVASFLGICLYFCEVHAVVALLTGFYPLILFF